MIRAGRLRHFVTVKRTRETRTSTGAFLTTWETFARDVPAEIKSVSGREFFQADQEQHEVDTKITMRILAGLTTKMRIEYGDAIYNIKAILPDTTQRSNMLVMCQSGADRG